VFEQPETANKSTEQTKKRLALEYIDPLPETQPVLATGMKPRVNATPIYNVGIRRCAMSRVSF
jgi:hypothetical protein